MNGPRAGGATASLRWSAWPMVAWGALVWVLLWGGLQPLVLVSALPVALLCWLLTGLPAPVVPARPRLWPGLRALGALLVDLVRSTAAVVVAVVVRGPATRSAVVAVRAPSRSDVAVAVAANRVSLVPGTLVVAVDREADLLYVHCLDVRDEAGVERARARTQHAVDQVLAAFGEPAGRAAGVPADGGRP
ncbi:Na+/H+ antiporter subunit E [Aquipuribacter nitratireducens]|uniref:Na+/H+ antiporter subunit E n=1 Tax=Aquipuribacter nitratireducens TaxID=650104 RepID=A0ABW0GSF7_9MICO